MKPSNILKLVVGILLLSTVLPTLGGIIFALKNGSFIDMFMRVITVEGWIVLVIAIILIPLLLGIYFIKDATDT